MAQKSKIYLTVNANYIDKNLAFKYRQIPLTILRQILRNNITATYHKIISLKQYWTSRIIF